jgi:hypothetical protein
VEYRELRIQVVVVVVVQKVQMQMVDHLVEVAREYVLSQ